MADETLKYVTLDTLKTYDGKLKPWVKDKIKSVKIAALEEAENDALKTYELSFTDGTGDSAVVTSLGKIDIPKDFLVKSGKVVIVKEPDDIKEEEVDSETVESTLTSGKAAGTYIKLVLNVKDGEAEEDGTVYINVADLYSDYKEQEDATEVQIKIDDKHIISATVVTGAITGGAADNEGNPTGKIALGTIVGANVANETINTDNIVVGAITGGTETVAGEDGESTIVKATGRIAAETIVNGNIANTTIARNKIDKDFEDAIKALEDFMGSPTDDGDIEGLEPGQEKPSDFDGFDWT